MHISRRRALGVVTANIGRADLSRREAAIIAVRNALSMEDSQDRPLVGWQEIGDGDLSEKEKGWIGEHFGPHYNNLHLDDGGHLVPISAPTAYTVLAQRVTPVHPGKDGVTPNRVITEVLLSAADDPALRFAFVNTHFVAGAYHGQDDPYEDWRDRMWALHCDTLRNTVMEYWRTRGYPVIWTGDTNRDPMPKLYPQRETRAFATGIDHIGWIQGTNGVQIQLRDKFTVPMNGARVAVLQLRRV